MPKIIKDIENKIFVEATYIFSQKGYHGTDMKAIAKACGIAVGTLYNYYPNKKSLYMAVFLKSWNNTINKLKKVSAKEGKDKEILKEFVRVFYEDTEARNGLGNDVKILSKKGDKDFDRIAKELFSNIINITISRFKLKEEFKNTEDILTRILSIWFSGQFSLTTDFLNKKEQNMEFLYSTIKNYFELQN